MSNGGVKVYKYGLLAPSVNAPLVRQQMRSAHTYHNLLIEIERHKRAALRDVGSSNDLLASLKAALDAATARETELSAAVRAERAAKRARKIDQSMLDELRNSRVARKNFYHQWREARSLARNNPETQSAMEEIGEKANELVKSAREHCNTYWGNYTLIEDAVQSAAKMPLYDNGAPNDPRFVRWTGEGAISVQIQKGMSAESVFGEDNRLRVKPVDEKAWYSEVRGERRLLSRTVLSVRVGSNPDRSPIWAEFPMIMHRPLPDGSVIKRATVHLRKIGPRECWSVNFIVAMPESRVNTCGKGMVAVNFGWRQIAGEIASTADSTADTRDIGPSIRVATYAASDSAVNTLCMEPRLISAITKADELRSIRDDAFDCARDILASDIAKLPASSLPEWFVARTQSLSLWKSPARLTSLCDEWKLNRFSVTVPRSGSFGVATNPEEAAFSKLLEWAIHDRHLWEWETSQRSKSLRRRRETYRIFAADLARKYETLVVDDFDLRVVAKRAPDESTKGDNPVARRNRQLASISELRGVLVNAFSGRGGRVVTVSSGGSTRTCAECSAACEFDSAVSLTFECACGAKWDQDYNAARNLLKRGIAATTAEKSADGQVSDLQTQVGSKWAKAKQKKEARSEARSAAMSADKSETGMLTTDNAAE